MSLKQKKKRAPTSRKTKRNLPPKAAVKTAVKTVRSREEEEMPAGPSGRRLWIFRIVTVVLVPLLFSALLEATLGIAGYGYDSGFVIPCETEGKPYLCDNVRFGWRFFPKNIAREPAVFKIPEEKSSDTYRIFVFGASAAKGTPDGAFSVGRVLEVMLTTLYPDTRFEVITAAAAAVNSHAVLPIAEDCAVHSPDLFVVYLGNNEVVGPYGAGTVFSGFSGSMSVIRLGIALRGTRIGQAAVEITAALGKASDVPTVWRGLEMFLGKQVRHDAPSLGAVYDHFGRNLKDIIGTGRSGGAQVILSTVASNLKESPPFASLHGEALSGEQLDKWNAVYHQGVAHEESGQFKAALEKYRAALQIDKAFADLHFRTARCHAALGDHQTARGHYIEARELDTLRFRADNRINQIIRETAESAEGVYLVDAVEAFADASPHRTPGESLFYEHVHFNFNGTYLLATALLPAVERALPARIRKKRADGSTPDLETCRRLLAHTEWDRGRLARGVLNTFISKPPFTNQLYHQESVERHMARIRELEKYRTPEMLKASVKQYEQALALRPKDWLLHFKLGTLFAEDLHALDAAAAEFGKVRALMPHSWYGYNALGTVLQAQGKHAEAIREFETALAKNPVSWDTLFLLAKAYREQGDLGEASARFKVLLEEQPGRVPAYQELAGILQERGLHGDAEALLKRGIEILPDSAVMHAALGKVYAIQQRWDLAAEKFRHALSIAPDAAPVRQALEQVEQMQK